jgi:hypothetical protein
METHLIDIALCAAALVAGGVIGLGFGTLQQAALRRHEERERAGRLKNGWTLMPGSGGRVALLLITLALIQLVCPLLFTDGTQWWVSGGLVAGYGWQLLQKLRQRRAQLR